MTLKPLPAEQRLQNALEATLLLNESIRELVIPRQIFALTEKIPDDPVNMQWLAGVRHLVLQSIVLAVYRLWETRSHFLIDWLFTDAELRGLNFLPIEEFVGTDRWSDFLIVRHTTRDTRQPARRRVDPLVWCQRKS
jgi:hypothetical protein